MINTIKCQEMTWVGRLLLEVGWSGECSLRTLPLKRGQRKQKREPVNIGRKRIPGGGTVLNVKRRSFRVREQGGGSHCGPRRELV